MIHKVVCRIRFKKKENELGFTWSEGAEAFKPYALDGGRVEAFETTARSARKRLRNIVGLHAMPPGERDSDAIGQLCFALARDGKELYDLIFDSAAEGASQVRDWFEGITEAKNVESLEIVNDEHPWLVPWNVVYDQEPVESAFRGVGDCLDSFKPFWGLRYNLRGGLPVDPLRRMPLPRDELYVLLVIDPVVIGELEKHADPSGASQKQHLQEFIAARGLHAVYSRDELCKALKAGRPHLIYWLGHAQPDVLHLGTEQIDLVDLGKILRSCRGNQRPSSGLVFLNSCRTAESSDMGSFLKTFHDYSYSGLIATEEQTLDNFASPFGLSVLEDFLDHGRPIGRVLHDLRCKNVPMGLLYGTYCPLGLQVCPADEVTDEVPLSSGETSSQTGAIALGIPSAVTAPPLPPLPGAPYLPLGVYGSEHRALFAGRDDDVDRFAMILDHRETRILVLHGESGVGKSSFLRAGVIPYLEEECIGYRFLRDRRKESEPSLLFIRATNDLAGQLAQAIAMYCKHPYRYETPTGEEISIDLPAILAVASGSASTDVLKLRAALLSDSMLLDHLLGTLSNSLPFTLVLVIDQAEEIFTLTESGMGEGDREDMLEILRRLTETSGDYKVIVSLRTEYYGRFIHALRQQSTDKRGVREYLLADLEEPGLVQAIVRPTLTGRIPHTSEVPREKYRFSYEEGLPEAIARGVLDLRTSRKDSVLPTLQVICDQLYERAMTRPPSARVIVKDDLTGGIEGAMRRHVESLVARFFPLDSPAEMTFQEVVAQRILDLARRLPDGWMKLKMSRLFSAMSRRSPGEPCGPEAPGRIDEVMAAEPRLEILLDRFRQGRQPTREAFRRLFARLYLRQPDGSLSTALIPKRDLAEQWSGLMPFDEVLRLTSTGETRLLRVDSLRIGSAGEQSYVSLGHDALAKVADHWHHEIRMWDKIWRMALASVTAVALAAVLAILSLVAWDQATRARASRQAALSNLLFAQETADRMLTQVGDIDLAEVPQFEEVRRILLEEAEKKFAELTRRVAADGSDDPKVSLGTARAKISLADLRMLQGEIKKAEPLYRDSIRLLDRWHSGTTFQDEHRRSLARAHDGLGILLKKSNRYAESEKAFLRAIRLRETSTSDEGRRELAESRYNLGTLLARLPGGRKDAMKAYFEAIHERVAIIGEATKGPGDDVILVRYLNNLGKFLEDGKVREWADAEDWARMEQLIGSYDEDWTRMERTIDSYLNARGILVETSEAIEQSGAEDRVIRKRAIYCFTRAMALGKYHVEKSPNASGPRWYLARSENNLASILTEDPKGFEEADSLYLDAEDGLRKLAVDFPSITHYRRELATVEFNLGWLAFRWLNANHQSPSEAIGHYEESLKLARELTHANPEDLSLKKLIRVNYGALANIARTRGEFIKAVEIAEYVLALQSDDSGAYLWAAAILANCPGHEERAVQVLVLAAAKGLLKGANPLDDPEFQPIVNRPDFQELRKRLAESVPPSKIAR